MAKYIGKKTMKYEIDEYLNIQKKVLDKKCFDSLDETDKEEKKAIKFYKIAKEISFVFEKEWVQFLLSKPGTTHLRAYYGAQSDGQPTIILVSAKKVNPYENVYLDEDDGGVEWPEGLPPGQSNGQSFSDPKDSSS